MKHIILVPLFLFLFFISASAQTLSTPRLIKCWETGGISQTTKAEATYADLRLHINRKAYSQRVKELDEYLNKHVNKRLEVRVMMYRILGKQELNIPLTRTDTQDMRHAITLAGLLNDRQLLSEVYSLYGERSGLAENLFYDLKAIDIQNDIGASHFSMLWLRYLSVSKALFHTSDFEQSIRYGKECLALMKSPVPGVMDYVLQLDVLGASYWQLGNADSTAYFYRQIGSILSHYSLGNDTYKNIWAGIDKGGEGMALFLQRKYTEAKPLLQQNVASSFSTGQWQDAAKAENILARIHFTGKKYDSALVEWRNTLQWATRGSDLLLAKNAVGGIRDVYETTRKYDSAFTFDSIYYAYEDTLIRGLAEYRLSAIRTHIEYSDMQADLIRDKAYIKHQLHVRNAMLVGILAITIFISFLFYLYNNKQKEQQKQLKHRGELSQKEAALAKAQIAGFSKNIADKAQLIETLKSKINGEMDENIVRYLRHFTILTDEDWQNFKETFEKVHPGFWTRLDEKFPHLTLGEKRFMALSRLGLDNKEMASVSGVSPETIRVLTYRMRKKLTISETSELKEIAYSI